jgi:two-component system sensor histidine kinase KdpD
MHARPQAPLLRRFGPSRISGLIAAAASVALTTVALFPLRDVAPVVSLGVVYLLAVLLVSTFWGVWLGVATAIASALAFNFFHLPPTGRLTIADSENLVALGIFLVTAGVASTLAERARARAAEADERRREADLAAELARLLLRGEDLAGSLRTTSARLAAVLELPSAAIELGVAAPGERRLAFALHEGPRQIGTLVLPAGIPEPALRRVQERVVPALQALLAAALERDRLLGEAVETRALRRSDVVKTALLRAISHDLRSPLTAILAAAEPLARGTLDEADRRELAESIEQEAVRLSRLIDDLLDISRLEAHAVEPRPEWCSIDEVLQTAAEGTGCPEGTFSFALDPDLPLVRADAVQLERTFANVLGNAARHSGGHSVSIRARAVQHRMLVRVVDRGPGIPPAQRERVFEPFYRAGTPGEGYRGSGLGLAIARGFVEANGGRIWVESLPGQGTAFVVELPLEPVPAAAPAAAERQA